MTGVKEWDTPMQITLFNELKKLLEEKKTKAQEEFNSLQNIDKQ